VDVAVAARNGVAEAGIGAPVAGLAVGDRWGTPGATVDPAGGDAPTDAVGTGPGPDPAEADGVPPGGRAGGDNAGAGAGDVLDAGGPAGR
jgi:hypothetical protein